MSGQNGSRRMALRKWLQDIKGFRGQWTRSPFTCLPQSLNSTHLPLYNHRIIVALLFLLTHLYPLSPCQLYWVLHSGSFSTPNMPDSSWKNINQNNPLINWTLQRSPENGERKEQLWSKHFHSAKIVLRFFAPRAAEVGSGCQIANAPESHLDFCLQE